MGLACNLVHMDASGLLAVMNGHFHAGSSVTVLSAGSPPALLSICQHSATAALGPVLTASAQQWLDRPWNISTSEVYAVLCCDALGIILERIDGPPVPP